MDCSTIALSIVPVAQGKDVLGEVLRQGAQKLLAQAIDAEVADWIDRHAQLRDDAGHRQVVRNGVLPARTITTGVGPVEVKQPRVHDRRSGEEREKFPGEAGDMNVDGSITEMAELAEHCPWLFPKNAKRAFFAVEAALDSSALQDLAEHSREILQLRFTQRLSFKEIADKLGSSEEATRKAFVRALGRFKARRTDI
jgi:Sigma-70, region 4